MGDQQTATDRHTSAESGPTLSRPQLSALEGLAAGSTVTDAARLAGVDRTTVHRWLREDFRFQAAWNRLRADLEREVEARIEKLVQVALTAVEEAIAGGDARVALAVLRGTGFLDGSRRTIGAEDGERLAADARITRWEEDAARGLREVVAGLSPCP